ncbi:MAG: membrane protein insertase YidC [Candidatus Coatesbacteria bacterium]
MGQLSTEQRLLLAIVLSTVIIIGYSFLAPRLLPQPAMPAATAETGAAVSPSAEPSRAPAAPLSAKERRRAERAALAAVSAARTTVRSPKAGVASDATGSEVEVATGAVHARFSTNGGRVLSWQLKAYRATGSTLYEELVSLRAAKSAAGPLSVRLSDFPDAAAWPAVASLAKLDVGKAGIEQRLPGRGGETVVIPRGPAGVPAGELVFTQALPGGRTLVKRLRFPATGYEVGVELELTGPAPETLDLVWTPGVGLAPDEEEALGRTSTYQNDATAIILSGQGLASGKQDLLKQSDAKKPAEKSGEAPFWAAVRNRYFVAALVPPRIGDCEGVLAVTGIAASDGQPHALTAALRFSLQPGARRVRIPVTAYLGPQEFGALGAAGSRLDRVLDLGWFGWIALPMLQTLKFLAKFTRNYGVAIILLTLIVRGLLWWPSQWGLNQMKRMQQVKPQMDFINTQFKNDPARKQEELMRLYKEQKINPVGGCLPLLLQIPIFFALYSALSSAVELHGTPFAFWIQDLSAMDPYYILPVLVGGTMFIQQAITPVVGDPAQAKMMRWMSVVFAFMFMKMPSGLMLYWLVQNLFQIVQQWRTNRMTAQTA